MFDETKKPIPTACSVQATFPIPIIDFTNKNVVVTGASGGIGSIIAAHFVSAGARVIMVDKERERLHEIVSRLALPEDQVSIFSCDITDKESCKALQIEIANLCPDGIHVLANVAGILPRETGSIELDEERWESTIAVNVKGTARIQRVLLEDLKKGAPSSILNIGSIQGFTHLPNSDAYSASKAAVHSMTKAWAQELGKFGIRCNAIAPGAVPTPMTESALSDPERLEVLIRRTPLGRLSEPRDIALSALVLSSGEFSRQITGTILAVDGGFLTY